MAEQGFTLGFGRNFGTFTRHLLKALTKKNLMLVLGLVPVSYVLLLVLGAGNYKTRGYEIRESDGERLFQSLLISCGVAILVSYFRRSNEMDQPEDLTGSAMRYFAKARDAYNSKGLHQDARECDLMIEKVSTIALDPRIDPKL